MSEPLNSVIVPVYNCAAYLEECLSSLMDQTFEGFEVFIVDDGSTDDSFRIARTCVKGDARFHFEVLPKNYGQSVARNKALDKACGEYLVLLDADDLMVPEALEKNAATCRISKS